MEGYGGTTIEDVDVPCTAAAALRWSVMKSNTTLSGEFVASWLQGRRMYTGVLFTGAGSCNSCRCPTLYYYVRSSTKFGIGRLNGPCC
jgi:hypothetical protein